MKGNLSFELNKELFRKITFYVVVGFFFLFPLYFLPYTFDLIEINKSLLLALFTLVLLGLLAYKTFVTKKLTININYLTVPLLLLALAVLLSFVFSSSISISLWGFYGALSNSFPILMLAILMPIVLSSVISTHKTVMQGLFYLVMGFSVSFVVSLLTYFGAFGFTQNTAFQFLNNTNFSLLGPLGTLRFASVLSAFLSAYFVIREKELWKTALSTVALTLSVVIAALYLPTVYALASLLVAAGTFYFYKGYLTKKKLGYAVSALAIGLAVFAVSLSPELSNSFGLQAKASFNSIDAKTSWAVTNEVIGNRPIFGTGQGTFIAAYSLNKPVNINNTNFWDTKFIKPSSYYLLLLVEMGLLGFVAFMFVVIKFIINSTNVFQVLTNKEELKDEVLDLSAIKISILIVLLAFLFTSGNALLLGLFFGLLGLLATAEKFAKTGKAGDKYFGVALGDSGDDAGISTLAIGGYKILHTDKIFLVLSILITAGTLFFGYTVLASDIVFKSLYNTPRTLLDLRNNYVAASRIHPRNDFYHRSVIEINKQIARRLLNVPADQQDQLGEEERQQRVNNAATILRESALRANLITTNTDLGVNPVNWEARGLLWQFIIGADQQAPVNAIQSYTIASQREPQNPRIVATIGTVYYQIQDYQQAAAFFERAVILKPDYAAARYNLARSLEQLNRNVDAYGVAQTVLQFVPEGSQDYNIAQDYVASLKLKAEQDVAAQQNQNNGTAGQENLNIQEGTTEPTNQPGLTEPGEPLQPAPEQTQTPSSEVPATSPDVVQDNEATTNQNDTGAEGEPTPSPTPSPSPTGDQNTNNEGGALPNQEPTNQEGGGFVEQNQ